MDILQEIQQVFQQREDIPLLYIESGSRLWGMASPDSDYDVRGFHLQPKAQYYDYDKHRDLIEIMQGDFDFVSYDLDKMFGLLAKSNPTVLEWVRAHIVYHNQFPEWTQFQGGLLRRVDYKALYYHYLSLAKSGMQVMQNPENFSYKKVFYSIRGLISAELATQQQMPALKITELFEQVSPQDPLRQWAEDYLEIKKQQREKALVPVPEQQRVWTLLNEKIARLSQHESFNPHDQVDLKNYLSRYSVQLKEHFYSSE